MVSQPRYTRELFDAIELEVFDPSSKLFAFDRDAVIILNASQTVRASFAKRRITAAHFVDKSLTKITSVWSAIRSHCRAMVVQSTYALPRERYFGNYDLMVPDSLYSVALALNAGIAEAARHQSGVLLHDVEGVASTVGRGQFFDDRSWDLWKTFCSHQFLPHVVQNLVDVLMAMRGRGIKCIVLDLDNTLWGESSETMASTVFNLVRTAMERPGTAFSSSSGC
jgi:predicted enzyme involved in methoxymalonyl-ACP biosynthesis